MRYPVKSIYEELLITSTAINPPVLRRDTVAYRSLRFDELFRRQNGRARQSRYADTTRPVTAAFAGAPGASFTVFGAAPQRDTATLSLAANTAVAHGVSLYARYDGEVATASPPTPSTAVSG